MTCKAVRRGGKAVEDGGSPRRAPAGSLCHPSTQGKGRKRTPALPRLLAQVQPEAGLQAREGGPCVVLHAPSLPSQPHWPTQGGPELTGALATVMGSRLLGTQAPGAHPPTHPREKGSAG
jgi:hypothetical protein